VGCREWGENRREVPKCDGLGVLCVELTWPPHPRPLSPVSRGRGEDLRASRGRQSAGEAAVALQCRGWWDCGFVLS